MKHDHCVACGAKTELQQHHLIPKAAGGTNASDNMITLCEIHHNAVHAVEKKLGHTQLIATAQNSLQKELQALDIWQGNWSETAKDPRFQEWKQLREEARRKENETRAKNYTAEQATLAKQFSDTLRPHLKEYVDFCHIKGKRPTLLSLAAFLNSSGIKTRTGANWTTNTVTNLLTRVGITIKQLQKDFHSR